MTSRSFDARVREWMKERDLPASCAALIVRALTHKSYSFREKPSSFERLEFVGDRILSLVIATDLYHRHPSVEEGILARHQAYLVQKDYLCDIADQWHIDQVIRVGGGTLSANILADTVEAVLGAVYLSCGFEMVQRVIIHAWRAGLEGDISLKDPKSQLQEWAHTQGLGVPQYTLVHQEGPDHAPVFHVRVSCGSDPRSVNASGPSRKTAERQAAMAYLEKYRL